MREIRLSISVSGAMDQNRTAGETGFAFFDKIDIRLAVNQQIDNQRIVTMLVRKYQFDNAGVDRFT